MKKSGDILSVLAVILLISVLMAQQSLAASLGIKLYQEAKRLEGRTDYFKATDVYRKAWKEFLKEGNVVEAKEARIKFQSLEKIIYSYPHSAEAVIEISKKRWPGISEDRVESWMKDNKIDSIKIAGITYYFDDFPNTVIHQNPDLLKREKGGGALGKYSAGFRELFDIIFRAEETKSWVPYTRPTTYMATQTLNVPREKLPKTGLLKLWFPLPVEIGPQSDVHIISITPDRYIELPPQTHADIGLAYMEVPLEKLKENLEVEIKYTFKHYEQHFRVDPDRVGEYDKGSELYKWYTVSRGDIRITPSIRKTAKEVAGGETNPYIISKRMYEYVVDETNYSHVPHLALDVMGRPESVYVHEKRIGDCGAQSMYYCALIRSLGIPARCPGGWQLIPGISGGHFWAEVYLPNYGWIPVDTSVGQLQKYFPGMTEEQRKIYKDFFFASMDPFRWVIQRDVDLPLTPPAGEPVFLSIAVQSPVALCDAMEEIPGVVIEKYWKVKTKPVAAAKEP